VSKKISCRSLLALLLVCTFAAFADQLSTPVRRTPFSHTTLGRFAAPKWAGSCLVWYRPATHSDTSPNLALHDREGHAVLETRVWVPGAAYVSIRDVDAVGGEVVAVGNAMVGVMEWVGFLAFVPVKGGAIRMVRTAPFEGESVAVGSDESVWILGWQVGEDRKLRNAPDHALLHRYSRDGKLIGTSMPWSSFRCGLHPISGTHNGGPAHVRASKDRIGVLLPGCHEWVEFNLDGELSGRWSWRDVPITNGLETSAMLSAVVMTPQHGIFARIGIGLYRLNREQGSWDPVDLSSATDSGAMFFWLAGNDGESLVYLSDRELVWANARR
jgi:hypothetical protein